jgi:DNA repair exonuclease SbcCD nuclease subunit
MDFISIADLHLSWKLYNIPELEQDLKDIFSRIVNIAIERKVNCLVVVGDLFDDNEPTPDLVIFVKKEIQRLWDDGVNIYGIAGDHDKSINGENWLKVCGIDPVDKIPEFAGIDFCEPKLVKEYLVNKPNKELVNWIFLHGQIPSWFPYIDEKKRLDFSTFPIFDLYPNLKGIILGDIHEPKTGTISDHGKEAFLGYCGSPGIIKSDEINKKAGLIYCQNNTLQPRIPFPLDRDFIKIDFTGSNSEIFNVYLFLQKYKDHKGKKPIFRVEYDKDSQNKLDKLKPLWQIGIVESTQVKSLDKDKPKESINIRAELSTDERMSQVLLESCPDKDIYDLLYELLTTAEQKAVLDKFKDKKLNESPNDISDGEQRAGAGTIPAKS